MSDSLFTALWIAWGVLFAVIEGAAIRSKQTERTLSGHVWALLRLRGPVWFLGAGFLVWLVLHFLGFGIV
jgi:hypothetical protein